MTNMNWQKYRSLIDYSWSIQFEKDDTYSINQSDIVNCLAEKIWNDREKSKLIIIKRIDKKPYHYDIIFEVKGEGNRIFSVSLVYEKIIDTSSPGLRLL